MKRNWFVVIMIVVVVMVILALSTYGADAKVGVQSMPGIWLKTGWNMVGWPLLVSVPLTDAMGLCYPQVTMMYEYDANDVNDPWGKYSSTAPYWFLNDLTQTQYMHGYWVRVSTDCYWEPGVVVTP